MNLVVVGSGYVGLVSGACLADKGHRVICVDISEERIEGLKRGEVPIYEPGLDAIIARNADTGALSFTTSLPEAMREADIFCIAVGTPPDEDGSADLRHVLAVAREIGQHMERPALIINKSTVPVGTAEKVRAVVDAELAARGVQIEYDVASNPEFLKEGMAIEDFMQPDRIIVGVDSPRARQLLDDLYEPFVKEGARLIHMGVRDAEMAKYAANAMLATTQAEIARALGVDVLAFLSIHNVAAAFLLMASPSKVELAVQLAPQGAVSELRWVQVSVLAVGLVVVSGLAVCSMFLQAA